MDERIGERLKQVYEKIEREEAKLDKFQDTSEYFWYLTGLLTSLRRERDFLRDLYLTYAD